MEGGLWSAVKRSVGGRSAFVSTFTAHGGPGELTLAPATPGDIVPLSLTNDAYDIAASSYLASDSTLEVDTGWGGAKSFFASDSLFVLQVTRNRRAVRDVVRRTARPHARRPASSTSWTPGTWSPGTRRCRTRSAKSTKSLFRSLTSGEVLVAAFTGPGTMLMQTRNLHAFADITGSRCCRRTAAVQTSSEAGVPAPAPAPAGDPPTIAG